MYRTGPGQVPLRPRAPPALLLTRFASLIPGGIKGISLLLAAANEILKGAATHPCCNEADVYKRSARWTGAQVDAL